ncbi:MAG: T9SS type A sorting domain-containing protein [Bacteroidales bacterium]|nr:T9SS type A sorting domain-containing protein [Bacteroidales bacterium]
MSKYKYNTLVCVRVLLIAAAVLCCWQPRQAAAQKDSTHFYTLTNGNIWWLDDYNPPAEQDAVNRYVRGWDKTRSWAEIRTLGVHAGRNTTLIASQGEIYLALNITYDPSTGEPSATIEKRRVAESSGFSDDNRGTYLDTTSQGFNHYCLWYRTSSSGYYYQEWENPNNHRNYRYYLTCDASNNLTVFIAPEGEDTQDATYWYDWDFGVATQKTMGTGNDNDKTEYYWISLDTTGHVANPVDGTWTVSGDSYQRPDEIMYNPYKNEGNSDSYLGDNPNMTYYDNRVLTNAQGVKVRNVPAVMPATAMPVIVETFERQILSQTGGIDGFKYKYTDADGDEWTNIGQDNTANANNAIELEYGKSVYAEPLIAYTNAPTNTQVTMRIKPEYRICTEETYRRGMNLNYRNRKVEEFGSKGIATVDKYYYWPDEYDGDWVKHDREPIELDDTPTIDSVVATIDNRSRRYLNYEVSNEGQYRIKITYAHPSEAPRYAMIIATVNYSNGTKETDTLRLHLTFTPSSTPAVSKRAPVIRGSVYGGGRVANVGLAEVDNNGTPSIESDDQLVLVGGNTHITVHSADSIYALYGGNDIAGWVEGAKGATIQLGTELTDEEHPVNIGWAYGGGCGFYAYDQVYDANKFYYAYYKSLFIAQGSLLSTATDEQVAEYMTPAHMAAAESAATEEQRAAATTAGNAAAWVASGTLTSNLDYGGYAFRGNVYKWKTTTPSDADLVESDFDYTPYQGTGDFAIEENGLGKVGNKKNGTVPYIRTSHITVGISDSTDRFHYLHNDYVYIDSLFGGAENAFIGVTADEENPENGVTIDINGGTMMTVFGGNNYGGSVATSSTVFVDVWNTKLTDEEAIENTYLSGYGRDFGIRHLFGGGNFVKGSHANVMIHGGMLDTVFLGGNRATVDRAYGTVECLREYEKQEVDDGHGGTMLVNDYNKPIIDRFGNIGHFIWTNPTTDTANNCINTSIDDWEGDIGRYNVRCLFGGNNNADMDEVALVQLHSGGVSTIYGGGNVGDMNNDDPISGMPGLYQTLLGRAFEGWDGPVPGKVGSIVAALHDSKIICEYVYGGCRQANVKNSCGVYAAGGAFGYINGGNDVSGDVGSTMPNGTRTVPTGLADPATIEIGTAEGTYVVCDSNVVVFGDIYAGSDGYLHCDDGDGHYNEEDLYDTYSWVAYDEYHDHIGKLLPTHNNTNLYFKNGIVRGNIYSGGINANVGFQEDSWPIHLSTDPSWAEHSYMDVNGGKNKGRVHTVIAGGEIDGQLFGGGFMSSIYGLALLHIKGSPIINEIYAGNDVAGSIENYDAYSLPPSPAIPDGIPASGFYNSIGAGSEINLLNRYNSTEDKYEAKYATYVRIDDTPRIEVLYGSGNGAWNYDGSRPQYDEVSVCEKALRSGARPHQKSAYIDIHTSGGYINTIYGGGNGAGVLDDNLVILLNNETQFNENPENMEDLAISSPIKEKKLFVGTIFGGNNFDPMTTCVPNIRLEKGCVKNVYGGSNAGVMGWKTTKYDAANNKVENVSTYVKVESANATITDSLFGGCRMSDVKGMAYVDVRNTTETGINYLYGGNDISGNIEGNTRVDVSGGTVHNIWGGSNGRYDFMLIGDNEYKVYPFGTMATGDTTDLLITIAAKPNVDSTQVNMWGGHITNSVYAGGSMADCRATCINIDDQHIDHSIDNQYLTIEGAIYGGGEGLWQDLNAERRGNVTGSTNVHMYHAQTITDAKAYGGGRGGDVRNTNITTYSSWDMPFKELYGGCWGSDVTGIAHLEFDGVNLVNHLFGGNDFTGNVYRSIINVNSGRFKNIYGGGNGNYPASYYTTNHPDATNSARGGSYIYEYRYANRGTATYAITAPNSEYIELNVYDGHIDSCIYGGGKLGTVMTYKRLPDGNYDLASRDQSPEPDLVTYPKVLKQPDTTRTKAEAYSNPEKYSYIIYNMHGGTVGKNIFAGGCGDPSDPTRKPIVYALKNVNMDGGYVSESVYGGSEYVNDGYAAECKTTTGNNVGWTDRMANTTLRPSSIVNVTGGTINGFLYGAGYLGDVYGSTYINVGMRALDTTMVYRRTYANGNYSKFKPGADGGLVAALHKDNNLYINHSIYSGANWGSNTGNTDFTAESYHGGESRIIVDGYGYNTANSVSSGEAVMNIRKSIIGSGTSANGGDLASDIILRDYGAINNCSTSKELESIQRADTLLFHRSAVELIGATDASQAYMSEEYSIKDIGNMGFRGYNVVQFDATVDEVGEMNVYKEDRNNAGQYVYTTVAELNNNTVSSSSGDCNDECSKTDLVDKTDHQNTLLVLNNGIDMYLRAANNYGNLNGYSYVTTPTGYSSTIAGMKSSGSYSYGSNHDGFVGTCDSTNKYINPGGSTYAAEHGRQDGPTWVDSDPNTSDDYGAEHEFINYSGYRSWTVGEGIRRRQTSILAHTSPDKLETENVSVKFNASTNNKETKLALAEAFVTLPATTAGSYFMLDEDFGFVLNGENAPLNLVDSAWLTSVTNGIYADGDNPSIRHYHKTGVAGHYEYEDESYNSETGEAAHGKWVSATIASEGIQSGLKDIKERPNNTFGLVMVTDENFTNEMPTGHTTALTSLVVTGNSYVNYTDHYCTPKVASGERLLPTMKLYLTYDTSFNSTFIGSATFRLKEYDSGGNPKGVVEIEVFISTIISDFTDIEDNVLAMYNNGRSNRFTRKVMLPAVMEERDLYITDITWVPTDGNGNARNPEGLTDVDVTDRFYLMPDSADVTLVSDDYPKERVEVMDGLDHTGSYYANSHNRFAMTIVPGENISTEINSVLGWNNINTDLINVYRLANATGNTPDRITNEWVTASDPDTVSHYEIPSSDGKGLRIGTLNGRGTTVLNFNLYFDGERMYDKIDGKGYVGKVVVGLTSYNNGEKKSRFTITMNVKTRENGDTIYLATAPNYVERGGVRAFPYNNSYEYSQAESNTKPILLGKSPDCYVHTFQQALAANVYQEGDVIAILDTVVIKGGKSVYIQGNDGPPIEVIRYDGHHHQFPGDSCVYRGPMVTVRGTGTVFSAKNIAFHGGADASMKKCKRSGSAPVFSEVLANYIEPESGSTQYYVPLTVGDVKPDTNAAFGPIIQAMDNANVYLADGTTIQHNWNAYGSLEGQYTTIEGDVMSNNSSRMGAISITKGATVKLKNNVTISYNYGHTFDIDDRINHRPDEEGVVAPYKKIRPANGVIYIDGGHLELEGSNDLTAISIKDNYLMDPYIHGDASQQAEARWWTYYPDEAHPETATRWVVNTSKFNTWSRANVFLTRTSPVHSKSVTLADTLNDGKSDRIIVSGGQSAKSSIGVRKWFPGLTSRDTINFATYSGGDNSVLADAVNNNVFYSDDDQMMFYSSKVNSSLAYLHRCVSFQHQYYLAENHKTIDPLASIDINSSTAGVQNFAAANIKSGSPLEFDYLEGSCPDGGDTIIYRVQGGFAPYTYTWSDPGDDGTAGNADDIVYFSTTTPYSNIDVQKDLNDESQTETHRLAKYLASVSDTINLPHENMSHTQAKAEHDLRVTAVDASGCSLYKDIHFVIDRSWDNAPAPITYIKSDATTGQITDNTVNDAVEATYAWKTSPTDGWVDTNRTLKAIASRNYNSIKVNPRVWVDRSSTGGVITAVVPDDDNDDYVYQFIGESESHELSTLYFCDGDIVTLRARTPYTGTTPNNHFIMWDFDPYYSNTAIYKVPAATSTVTAYYGPNAYWKDHINSTTLAGSVYDSSYTYAARPTVTGYTSTDESSKAGFVTTYNGDVHIYDENGLAWFISVVNGLNGTQAREFYFNNVYIHKKSNGTVYDMKDYLWTSVGSHQHAFRGRLYGVDGEGLGLTDAQKDSCTTPATTPVIIKNIIVDEPDLENAGFFAFLDKAKIKSLHLQSALIRGSQYVGTFAARSQNSKLDNVIVDDDQELETNSITTILTTHYASGGILGRSYKDTVTNSIAEAKYVGDAVYSGGMVGYGESASFGNSSVRNDNRMSGLYVGGLAGYLNGTAPVSASLFRRKSNGEPSIVRNNYVHLLTNGKGQRVGGIVGQSSNTIIENNYVYGILEGETTEGGVAALADQGTQGDHNYYAKSATNRVAGQQRNGAVLDHTTSFEGKGNQVTVQQPMYGVNNLTRVLNLWVREHDGEGYKTWRSDLDDVNSGYPIFGVPDMIPVSNVITMDVCDSIELDGYIYDHDSVITVHVIDSVQMIDSTSSITFIVHHSSREHYSDSTIVGESYEGYGFSLSATESELMRETVQQYGYATIQLSDTLSSAVTGCDSIVSLTLVLTSGGEVGIEEKVPSHVIIYPNPTISIVNIEAEGLEHVELYDNEGRKLKDYTHAENNRMTINIGAMATGVYYLRVYNSEGVTVQKIIKK